MSSSVQFICQMRRDEMNNVNVDRLKTQDQIMEEEELSEGGDKWRARK